MRLRRHANFLVLGGFVLLVVAGVFLWGEAGSAKSEKKNADTFSRPSASTVPGAAPVPAAVQSAGFDRHPGRVAHAERPVSAGTLQQMEERIREKKRRPTFVEGSGSKLSPSLAALAQKVEAALARAQDPRGLSIPGAARVDASGAIQVYVETSGDPTGVLASIQTAGLKTELTLPESRQVQGWISASRLAALSSLDQVRRVTLPGYAYKNKGSVTTEGDALLKADKVRALASPGPYTGEGTKVCIISDGCNSRAASVTSGDLPAEGITMHPTLQDSGDEGTAMAEIIHDLAPGAKLYAAGPSTSLEMVVAIQWAVARGCHVICDDLGFWDQPFFEDGAIAVAARAAVVNNGVVVVSSAGNKSDDHYQGMYDAASGDTVQDFQSGSGEDIALDIVVPADGWAVVHLQWNDAFGQSGNDYDLLLSDPDANGEIVATSEYSQNGTGLPIEDLYWQNTSGVEKIMHVLIDKYAGSAKTLELFVTGDSYLIDDDWVARDSIYGHPAVTEVISVGAIDQADPGLVNLETYSSQGPSTIAFPSSQSRRTPTIAAVDGVTVTGAGGFDSPFFGTSASAPHVAGICALMLDKNPNANPTQIKDALTAGAADRGAAGFDNSYGYGLVNALAAVNGLSAPGGGPEIAVELSSGEGLADKGSVSFASVSAGSTSRLTFTIKNTGSSVLTGLAATKDGLNVTDFTVGRLAATSLAPGAQTSFDVVFYPSANGSRTAALHIASNDGDENPFDITLRGERAAYAGKGSTLGRPGWNRPEENGPNVPVELSGSGVAVPYETFHFTVGTSGTYTIRGIATWDNFLVLYANSFNASSPLSNVLRAYGGFPVWGRVEFPVRLTAGTTYILVTTGYSDPDFGEYATEITGPGIVSPSAQPEIVVSQPASVALGNGAGAGVFGNVNVGSVSAPLTFTIKNSGVGDLTGLTVTKDGSNAEDFTVSPLGVSSLSVGANTTFTISFAPGAGGSRVAAVHIASNDGDESPFDIPLAGVGIVPTPDTTAPVLSISSPANNAKLAVPNAAFSGKIVEAGGVPTVEFSTDGGTNWTAGTVTLSKSPYAWTATVPLVPGTNSVQIRSKDSVNNGSAVVTRTISYTVPQPKITLPAAGAKLSAAAATFQGTVADVGGKPGVEISTDGGTNWSAVTVGGTKVPYAWSANTTLVPGSNEVLVRTVDVLGQKGVFVSRSVTYLSASGAPLQITASGNGTFTGGLSGKALNLNMPYTVTATPGKGQIFKEWLDGKGNSLSREAKLTFVMEEGLELTPVFIDNPYPGVKDTFNGLAGEGDLGSGTESDRNAFFQGNGFVSVTTTDSGSFSGTLRLEGQSLNLRGQFDGYGEESLEVKRTGKSNAVVAIKIDTTAPGKISGNVTTGGSPMAFEALPGEYSGVKSDVHPLSGKRYTVILPAPEATYGHGYATLVVAANGTATFAGKLADGASFTTSARTVDDGSGNWVIPVHIPLYTGSKGMLWGEVVVPQTGTGTEGSMGWLRAADAKATLFGGGFLKGLSPVGERYALVKDVSLFSGNATTAGFTLEVDPLGRVLEAAVTQAGTWPKSNSPVLTTPVQSKLALSFAGTTGVFKGTFNRTVSGGKTVSTAYEGVVLGHALTLPGGSTAIRGGGFFSTGSASGQVEMTVP